MKKNMVSLVISVLMIQSLNAASQLQDYFENLRRGVKCVVTKGESCSPAEKGAIIIAAQFIITAISTGFVIYLYRGKKGGHLGPNQPSTSEDLKKKKKESPIHLVKKIIYEDKAPELKAAIQQYQISPNALTEDNTPLLQLAVENYLFYPYFDPFRIEKNILTLIELGANPEQKAHPAFAPEGISTEASIADWVQWLDKNGKVNRHLSPMLKQKLGIAD